MVTDTIPYFLLSLFFGIVAIVGKQESISHEPWTTYVLMVPKSVVQYLQSFLAPIHLSVVYPYVQTVSITSTDIVIPLIIFCALTIVTILCARKNMTVLFGSLFFLIMLIPSFTNISKNGDLYVASDRYAYVPMIGLLFMIATAVEWFCSHGEREKMKRTRFQTASILVGMIILVLASTAFERSKVWASTQTLFADATIKEPSSYLSHEKLGSQLIDDGNFDGAEKELRTSIALKDNQRAHYNLGLIFMQRNDMSDALTENEKAIALDPTYAPAHVNLGYLQWKNGDIPDAIAHFKAAINNEQNNIDARLDLAVIYSQQGKKTEALNLINEILAIDPQNLDALNLKKAL